MANLATLQRFKKGDDPRRKLNLEGRPRKLLSKFAQEGYKASEIIDLIKALTSLTKSELEAVKDNPEATVLEVLIAKAVLKDIKDSTFYTFEPLIQRIAGKPDQTLKVEQKPTQELFAEFCRDSLKKILSQQNITFSELSEEQQMDFIYNFGLNMFEGLGLREGLE